ncbi:DUF1801 domain-containing protein [Georgenia thermotolerans]|uniref:DUF1801 domain-containing protein n=1 Tax=Georgenia thermotolerans TaxID=527326 RepID=A0A7J5UNX0_9MICO|nr:DUF1801 domain-containing protein [Georgenia thermotolerans]KAE8764037.1 DUF1801 domain-containing protein [Georgenia thermotolerans]
MTARSNEVAAYLAALQHPFKPGVERLRAAILAANDEITERVKWNAPSFCYADVDRATFRLQPGDRLQLVLHRGATKRGDGADFHFEDPFGLLEWVATDRAVITFRDLDDVAANEAAVVDTVIRWMRA